MTPDKSGGEDIEAVVRTWVEAHWDPDCTLGEWWQLLCDARLAVPHWPTEWFGRGWTRAQSGAVARALRAAEVPGPPAGLGVMLAGPTILRHGTDDHRRAFLPSIVNGQSNWCQLFSEPAAGSDLASVQTRAEREGDGWVIHGQKVWTSNGQIADTGMLLARTGDPAAKRHNLTWFALDMRQAEIDVRPLREMTGRSLFTEVFIDGARTTDDRVIGGVNNGWTVARTTLLNERLGLGAGVGAVGGVPGRQGGMLGTRAGDAVKARPRPVTRSGTSVAMGGRAFDVLAQLARDLGQTTDPLVRADLARLYTTERLAQLLHANRRQLGRRPPEGAQGPLGKLIGSEGTRIARELGMRLLGPAGTLYAGDRSLAGIVQELCLFSPAVSIYGGTDQIQRNVLAERVLGLPREPMP